VHGGGEREAHTIFDYGVSATAFPPSLQYVALGHLHRSQTIPGPCPIRYAGSPLQLDFGETADVKSVLLIEAHPGRPVEVEERVLRSGRRLRTLDGPLDTVLAQAGTTGDDFLRVRLREAPRVGLAEQVREALPDCVDVQIVRPEALPVLGRPSSSDRGPLDRTTLDPSALFRQYLNETRGTVDDELVALFSELVEEQAG
jgi:exonuclease SbcD